MAKANSSVTDAGLSGRVQGAVGKIRGFFEDVVAEFKKVTWPSQEELKASTAIVLIFLVLTAVMTGAMDLVGRQVVLLLLEWTA